MSKTIVRFVICAVLLAGCEESRITTSSNHQAGPAFNVQSLSGKAYLILENSLQHKNAQIRTNAIEIVVETERKELTPRIIKLLDDPIVPVRFGAAAALGDLRCFGCQEQIIPLLEDANGNVRIAAAYAMVRLNKPEYRDILIAGTKDSDQTVRANAVLLVGKLGNREDLDLLYDVSNDPASSEKVRLQAVESIARLGDERMYRSKLWALQISKYADDRVMGIRGMGVLNTPESHNAVVTMLKDDVQEVRLAAAEQLGRFGDKRGEEEVYGYLQSNANLDEASMASGMAVMAIGRIQSNRLNSYLPRALESKSDFIRLLAAQSVLLQVK